MNKKETKKTWIYGIHSCLEALKNSNRFAYEARCTNMDLRNAVQKIRPNLRAMIVGPENISNAVKTTNHQGMAIYCDRLEVHHNLSIEALEGHERVLILDRIQDINNLGAIMRSMAALGFTALVATRKNMPEIEKHGLKTSCGAIEHLTIFQIANLTEGVKFLKKQDFYCIGLDHRGKEIGEMIKGVDMKNTKIVGVIGSEGEGIRKGVLKECDICASLETSSSFQVLNASVAAGIFMYIIFKG